MQSPPKDPLRKPFDPGFLVVVGFLRRQLDGEETASSSPLALRLLTGVKFRGSDPRPVERILFSIPRARRRIRGSVVAESSSYSLVIQGLDKTKIWRIFLCTFCGFIY